jgi:nucleotidyltransferase substrate binding protein (TIGR01987 family)
MKNNGWKIQSNLFNPCIKFCKLKPGNKELFKMELKDIRWKQRFGNFKKAFLFLKSSVELKSYTPLEASGLVKAFEFTFELAWKTLKDFLEVNGVDSKTPREVIKQAFSSEIIEDGHMWMIMLEKRNEFSHTYDEAEANKAVNIIKEKYFKAIEQVFETLGKKVND